MSWQWVPQVRHCVNLKNSVVENASLPSYQFPSSLILMPPASQKCYTPGRDFFFSLVYFETGLGFSEAWVCQVPTLLPQLLQAEVTEVSESSCPAYERLFFVFFNFETGSHGT